MEPLCRSDMKFFSLQFSPDLDVCRGHHQTGGWRHCQCLQQLNNGWCCLHYGWSNIINFSLANPAWHQKRDWGGLLSSKSPTKMFTFLFEVVVAWMELYIVPLAPFSELKTSLWMGQFSYLCVLSPYRLSFLSPITFPSLSPLLALSNFSSPSFEWVRAFSNKNLEFIFLQPCHWLTDNCHRVLKLNCRWLYPGLVTIQ